MRFAIFLSAILLSLSACKSDKAPKEDISTLEAKLAKEPDQATLQNLLVLYQEEAQKSTGEAKLEFLWKTGETARAVREFSVAEKSFMEIYEGHTDHELAGKALFLHAFMCDEDLRQFDKAKVLYESFLEKYPQSDFNDDAQFLLQHLGKSDEEMLELLSKGNEEK